jgi:hypothetical protein
MFGGGPQVVVPGMSPEQLAQQKAIGTAEGTAIANARTQLPAVQQQATQALQTIEQLRTHPGRSLGSGLTGTVAGQVPGTHAFDFQQLNQQAQAGVFADVAKTLLGLGSLSNTEGDKLQKSVTNLDTRQSREGYEQGLNTYKKFVQVGIQNLQKIARGEMQPYAVPAEVASGGGSPAQARPQFSEGQTATNKQTGQRMIFKGGSWQAM